LFYKDDNAEYVLVVVPPLFTAGLLFTIMPVKRGGCGLSAAW